MVSPEGACAAYYNYGRYARERRGRWPRERAADEVARTASSGSSRSSRPTRAKRPRFKDERVTMAHGAGGKATQTLIEGLLAPGVRAPRRSTELADAGRGRRVDGRRARADHRHLRRPAAALPRRLDRRARRQRHRQRPRRRRRAAARDQPSRWCSRRASTPTCCGPRSRRSRGRRGGRGRGRHRRHEGGRARPRRRDVRHAPPGIGARRPARRALDRERSSPATGCSSRGTIGEHGTAIMLARGELGLEADVESDTRSLWPAADALLDVGRRRRCARCATRPAAASRRCSTSSPAPRASAISSARPTSRCAPDVAGACELLGIDPMYVANEGVMVAFVAPGGRRRGARRRCARSRAARRRRRSRRSGRSRPGWCWWRRRSAAGG